MVDKCPVCGANIRTFPDVLDAKFEKVALSTVALRPHDCRIYSIWGEAVTTNGDGST